MNKHAQLLIFALCFFCYSCEDTTTGSSSTTVAKPDTTTPAAPPPPAAIKTPLPDKHDCKIEDAILEENQFWLKEEQTLVGIVADETTKSIDFGESHRIWLAIDTRDCKTLLRETLPVNSSPDYPYYLNTNTYEPTNKIICSQGFEAVICYDAVAKKLLPKLEPQYLTARTAEDAQSGLPAGLEVWNNYLIGNTMDFGAYVFDISNKVSPKAVLPSAEYLSPEDASYTSLFLLEEKPGFYQALIPTLNEDQDGTEVKQLFEEAQAIAVNVNKNVRNNRFIVLKKTAGDTSVAIDMNEMKEVALPEAVAAKNVQEILAWLKAQ